MDVLRLARTPRAVRHPRGHLRVAGVHVLAEEEGHARLLFAEEVLYEGLQRVKCPSSHKT